MQRRCYLETILIKGRERGQKHFVSPIAIMLCSKVLTNHSKLCSVIAAYTLVLWWGMECVSLYREVFLAKSCKTTLLLFVRLPAT